MDYPFHIHSPSEATLVCQLLAAFSRIIASSSLLEAPSIGDPIVNRAARNAAASECATLIVRSYPSLFFTVPLVDFCLS